MGGCTSTPGGTKDGNLSYLPAVGHPLSLDINYGKHASVDQCSGGACKHPCGWASQSCACSMCDQPQRGRMCGRLRVFTEPDSIVEDCNCCNSGSDVCSSVIIENSKYVMTPIVAFAPFVKRELRALTVSRFQSRFGSSRDLAESQKQEAKPCSDESKDKVCLHATPTYAEPSVSPLRLQPTKAGDTADGADDMEGNAKDSLAQLPQSADESALNGKGEESVLFPGPLDTGLAQLSPSACPLPLPEVGRMNQSFEVTGQGAQARECSCGLVETKDSCTPTLVPLSQQCSGGKPKRRRFFPFRSRRSPREESDDPTQSSLEKHEGKKKAKNGDSRKQSALPPQVLSREQIICIGSQRLKKRLEDLELVEHLMRGDGNCQFRAVAQQLLGSEDYHELVRVHVVTYMKSVRDVFDCYFPSKEEADTYYDDMLKVGTWGDELTLRAASDSLFINVHILSSEQENYYLTYYPNPDSPPPPVFLVDVATMREERERERQQRQQQLDSHGTPSNQLGSGKGAEASEDSSVGDQSVCPVGATPTLSAPDHFTLPKNAVPSNSTCSSAGKSGCSGATGFDEKKHVDACALQQRLQRKLATTTVRAASAPVKNLILFSNEVLGMEHVNTDNSLHSGGGVDAAASSTERKDTEVAHKTTVSQDMERFCTTGAHRINSATEKVITVNIPNFTVMGESSVPNMGEEKKHGRRRKKGRPDVQRVASEEEEKEKEEKAEVAQQSPAPPSEIPRSTSFILLSPRTANGESLQSVNSGSAKEPNSEFTHSQSVSSRCLLKSSDASSTCLSLSHSLVDCEQAPRFVFEAHREPIDVFLSYLSHVHYNALSLARSSPNCSLECGAD
ncbi:hypothetical protein TRVL_06417 [Trypanosoma vivax]|nr:hypothetical protein TRVL_06417 [Trypanosoma vivax]